tara:strand:+ start:564 stop:737 length:174 start_codon:yes stop_codon:yes gene_type:complete
VQFPLVVFITWYVQEEVGIVLILVSATSGSISKELRAKLLLIILYFPLAPSPVTEVN